MLAGVIQDMLLQTEGSPNQNSPFKSMLQYTNKLGPTPPQSRPFLCSGYRRDILNVKAVFSFHYLAFESLTRRILGKPIHQVEPEAMP